MISLDRRLRSTHPMRHQPGGQAAATERQSHPDQLAELEAADRLQYLAPLRHARLS